MNADRAEADRHRERGKRLAGQGKIAEAAEAFRAAIAADPGSAFAHNNLGMMLARLGEIEAGRAMLEKALALDAHAQAT